MTSKTQSSDTPRITRGSVFVSLLRVVVRQFRASSSHDTTTASLIETSVVVSAIKTFVRWTRHSTIYRLFNGTPSSDTIVIDLRETYTVGPVISVFERLEALAQTAWHTSSTRQVVAKLAVTRRVFDHSRSVQLLAIALKPPSYPEEEQE